MVACIARNVCTDDTYQPGMHHSHSVCMSWAVLLLRFRDMPCESS